MKIIFRTYSEENELTPNQIVDKYPTIDGAKPQVENINNSCNDVIYDTNEDFNYSNLSTLLDTTNAKGSINAKGRTPYIFLQHEQTDSGNQTMEEFFENIARLECENEEIDAQEALRRFKEIDPREFAKVVATGALDGSSNNQVETAEYAIRNLGINISPIFDDEKGEYVDDYYDHLYGVVIPRMFDGHYLDRIDELQAKVNALKAILDVITDAAGTHEVLRDMGMEFFKYGSDDLDEASKAVYDKIANEMVKNA